jgi:hypothetical protein
MKEVERKFLVLSGTYSNWRLATVVLKLQKTKKAMIAGIRPARVVWNIDFAELSS